MSDEIVVGRDKTGRRGTVHRWEPSPERHRNQLMRSVCLAAYQYRHKIVSDPAALEAWPRCRRCFPQEADRG